jgi:hypothetical protein
MSAWEEVTASLGSPASDHLLSDSDGGQDSSGSRRDSMDDASHVTSAPIAVPALLADKVCSQLGLISTVTDPGLAQSPENSPATSVDSWQLVEESSSLRSTLAQAFQDHLSVSNGSKPTPPPLELDLSNPSPVSNGKTYPCTCQDEGRPCRAMSHTPTSLRAQRLHQVRALFIPLYQQAVPTAGSHDGWMNWINTLLMPSWAGTGAAPVKR